MDPKDFIHKQIEDMEGKRGSLQEEFDAASDALAKTNVELGGEEAKLKALNEQVVISRKSLEGLRKTLSERALTHEQWGAELIALDIQLAALKAYLKG